MTIPVHIDMSSTDWPLLRTQQAALMNVLVDRGADDPLWGLVALITNLQAAALGAGVPEAEVLPAVVTAAAGPALRTVTLTDILSWPCEADDDWQTAGFVVGEAARKPGFAELVESIRTQGILAPVVYDTTKRTIVDGVDRLAAAQALGMTHVPVHYTA